MLSSRGCIKGKSGSCGAPAAVLGAIARTSGAGTGVVASAVAAAAAAAALKSPGLFHVQVDAEGVIEGGLGAFRGLVQTGGD